MKYYVAVPSEATSFVEFKKYLEVDCKLKVVGNETTMLKMDDGGEDMPINVYICESSVFKFIEFCFVNRKWPIWNKKRPDRPIVPIG